MEWTTQIKNKFIMLDTNVLIDSFENFDAFEGFFQLLLDQNCRPIYFPFIEFEFTRVAFEPSNKEKRAKFLRYIASMSVPMPVDEMGKSALEFAQLYQAKKLKSPQLVDCCIAAYLRQYPDNLFLATANHKDFPTFLFDCIHLNPIDGGMKIIPVGIYKYNLDKAKINGLT